MARRRNSRIFPLALSIDAAADALAIRRATIIAAIRTGALTARKSDGGRIRVSVHDLIAWFSTWPIAELKHRQRTIKKRMMP